jgi:hypothetical protein
MSNVINVIVTSSSNIVKNNLVRKLEERGWYRQIYKGRNAAGRRVVTGHHAIVAVCSGEYSIRMWRGLPHQAIKDEGRTVALILYDPRKEDALDVAGNDILAVRSQYPDISILLVAVEYKDVEGKHAVPLATYTMTYDCTFFSERDIRSRSGSATGNIANLVYQIAEEVTNQTKGNAEIDIVHLKAKKQRGKHSCFGWYYYDNDDPEYLTDRWFSNTNTEVTDPATVPVTVTVTVQ